MISSEQAQNIVIEQDSNEWDEIEDRFMELQPLFVKAIELIKDQIEAGEWTNIIAEDSSGRIPALVIRRIMSRVYESRGRKGPDLQFLAGSKYIYDPDSLEKFDSYAEVIAEHISGRALVVTEYIESGETTGKMLQDLTKAGIDADVLTFGASSGTRLLKNASWRERRRIKKGTTFYSTHGELEGEYNQRTSNGPQDPENITMVGLMLELKKRKHTGISKEHLWKKIPDANPPIYKGERIPVAEITDKDQYLRIRELANKVADLVYDEVFGVDQESQHEELPMAA